MRPDYSRLSVHTWDAALLDAPALARIEHELIALERNCVLLQTCQRLELYGLDAPQLGAPRVLRGRSALRHAARVAGGLDSLVLGEQEVFAQLRSAVNHGSPEVARMLRPALAAARQLRRESSFDAHTGHLLDLALSLTGVQPQGALLVVGTGVAGRRVAQRAHFLGFQVTVAGRKRPEGLVGAAYLPLGAIRGLGCVDVVVTCLSRNAPLLGKADLPPARLLIDLGNPPNTRKPLAAERVVDTAALLLHSRQDMRHDSDRHRLESRLDTLLEEQERRTSADGDSPIGSLRRSVERVRQRELRRAQRLHPEVPMSALDVITRSLVNQIFHAPTTRLKASADVRFSSRFAALWDETEALPYELD